MTSKEYRHNYYLKNREKLRKQQKEYYKKWYAINKDEKQRKNNIWLENNREKRKEYLEMYEKENHDKILKRKLKRRKERIKNDIIFKLKEQARDTIKKSFRGFLKGKRGRTKVLLGCDLDFFVNYLLETYKNNYGVNYDYKEKVHIDHIIPLATANSEEDIIKLCHYTNLQLLKAKDNLSKNKKLDWRL